MIKCYINGHDYNMTNTELNYMRRYGIRKYDTVGHSKHIMYKCSECGMLTEKGYITISEFDHQRPDKELSTKIKEKLVSKIY